MDYQEEYDSGGQPVMEGDVAVICGLKGKPELQRPQRIARILRGQDSKIRGAVSRRNGRHDHREACEPANRGAGGRR